MSVLAQQTETTSKGNLSRILIGCALLYTILQVGITWVARLLDQTWAALIVAALMLVVALALEKVFFGRDPLQGLQALGFGRPNARALVVALIIGAVMLAFFPIFSILTGAQISLRSDWLWILVAIIVFNGIGEETLFRGYVFGGLRRDAGLPFRQAGFISMIIFAAVHLVLFIGNPFFVGVLGTLIAISAAFPM